MTRLPSACVIGAGSSGIAATKTLDERGFDVDTYEASDRVGGNWVFGNPNGVWVHADLVVSCTGHRVTFPFFDPGFISAPGNDLPLFRRVLHPDVASLAFIGLFQPLGAVMPPAELQSRWVCDHLEGRCAPPDRAAMLRDMKRERRRMSKRYVPSKRHTMQVDFEDYVLGAERERAAGARRARRLGGRLPVALRTTSEATVAA